LKASDFLPHRDPFAFYGAGSGLRLFFRPYPAFSLSPGDFVQRKYAFVQKVYGKTPGTCYVMFIIKPYSHKQAP
jgi:hypothetical protein